MIFRDQHFPLSRVGYDEQMEVALVPISDHQIVMWCPSETTDHWETAAFTKTKGCAHPQACCCPCETKWAPVTVTPSTKSFSTHR